MMASILSVSMAPVLLWTYVRLARREEQEMAKKLGEAYRTYRDQVPAFFPRVRLRRAAPSGDSLDPLEEPL